MRAMVLHEPGPIDESPLRLEDVPIPDPGPGEIRLKVEACGICRTDLHVVEADLPPKREAVIPGHQIAGTVDAAGPGAIRFSKGANAGIAWLRSTCGKCRYCTTGKENLCDSARFTGYHENGGYAEYAVVREDFAYPIPAGIGAREATPLLCAGIIGYRALKRADIKPGCRLGLYGFGNSAHISIQVARHLGCTVYVMTRDERHQKLARELGAAWAGGAADTPPEKLDSAVLYAPVGELVLPALEALDKGGTLSLAGIYMTPVPELDYERHLFYEKNLRSVTANTRDDGHELLRLAAEIPIKPETVAFPLAEANQALQKLKNDAIRGAGVLMMDESS